MGAVAPILLIWRLPCVRHVVEWVQYSVWRAEWEDLSVEPQSCGIGSLPQNFVDYNVCYFDGFHVCNKAWNECGVREAWSTGGRAGWEDQSVEPQSCGSGSLPPIPPALAASTAAQRHRGLHSRMHILSTSISAHYLNWPVTSPGYLKRIVVGRWERQSCQGIACSRCSEAYAHRFCPREQRQLAILLVRHSPN